MLQAVLWALQVVLQFPGYHILTVTKALDKTLHLKSELGCMPVH